MKKCLLPVLSISFIIGLSFSCSKPFNDPEPDKYDHFPLKTGNRFYYGFKWWYHDNKLHPDVPRYFPTVDIGTEVWTIVSEIPVDTGKQYKIESEVNYNSYYYFTEPFNDQPLYKYNDQPIHKTYSINVTENQNHELTFTGISFSEIGTGSPAWWHGDIKFFRYQPIDSIKIEFWYTFMMAKTYWFIAGKGLTEFNYWHGPNQRQDAEWILDSVKLAD